LSVKKIVIKNNKNVVLYEKDNITKIDYLSKRVIVVHSKNLPSPERIHFPKNVIVVIS
jgi:hypothetical protein